FFNSSATFVSRSATMSRKGLFNRCSSVGSAVFGFRGCLNVYAPALSALAWLDPVRRASSAQCPRAGSRDNGRMILVLGSLSSSERAQRLAASPLLGHPHERAKPLLLRSKR